MTLPEGLGDPTEHCNCKLLIDMGDKYWSVRYAANLQSSCLVGEETFFLQQMTSLWTQPVPPDNTSELLDLGVKPSQPEG